MSMNTPPIFCRWRPRPETDPTQFDHSFSDAPTPFTPALGARYLLARQAYSIGFGESNSFYFKDYTLIRGYSTLPLGNNLWCCPHARGGEPISPMWTLRPLVATMTSARHITRAPLPPAP